MSRPDEHRVTGEPRAVRRAGVLGAARLCLALCLALLVPGPAVAEPQPRATAKVQAGDRDGYARIVLKFDRMLETRTRVSNGIIVVGFSEPVNLPVDRIENAIASYVSGARRDPDAKALRIALARRVVVNTMVAGDRLFIDLLPESWKTQPPSLPQEVIDELSAKAKEMERLQREAASRLALAKPKPIEVKAARQPTFTRVTFVVGDPVPVRLERAGDDVVVTFDGALRADVSAIRAALPPLLAGIEAKDRDARLTIALTVDKGADVRAFWDGSDYVVDLAGARGSTQAAAQLPPSLRNALEEKVEEEGGVTILSARGWPAEAEASSPRIETRPATGQNAPAAGAHPEPAGKRVHSARPHPESKPAASDNPVAAATAAAVPPPPVVAAPTKDASADHPPAAAPSPDFISSPPVASAPPTSAPDAPLKPVITKVGSTVRIAFPFDRRTPAAVYRRGDNLWLVFDSNRPIELDALVEDGKPLFADASTVAADGSSVVRIKLRTTPLTTLSPDGLAWIVTIGDAILSGAQPVALHRIVRPDGRTAVSARLEGVGRVHRIDDTQVGDTVTVVTASAPARAFLKPQEFVEFRTLSTAHGLAFVASADDLIVSVGVDEVTVNRDGGLTLSSTGNTVMPAPEKSAAMLDAAQFAREVEAPFQKRERELIHAAADATDPERLAARMSLARFYLAKDFAPEASAVLDVAAAADKNVGRIPEFAVLRAGSQALMGRAAETNRILADSGLVASAEGSLWRSLVEANGHHFAAAREAFQKGAGAIDLYPKPLQSRFRLAAYEAALEVGEAADADTQRAAIEELGIAPHDVAKKTLLDARLAEIRNRKAEALESYRRLAEGPAGVTAAEARLRAIRLRHAMGQVDDKVMLSELETIAAIWRGDEIEADTLRVLAQENLRAGNDRAAFENMRVALRHFPKSEITRVTQDRMQERFTKLFLGGDADRLKPIEALALFYDFRELTPTDRRGDEMIRRLADRLVAVDLLDQGAELLHHQIANRLSGAGRAQVAAKLAMIYLMNRKPSQALQVLASTRQADLPRSLTTARLIIEARALSESARPELALEILDNIDSPDSTALKADVLWQARRWMQAGEAFETLLADSWQTEGDLDVSRRSMTMRAAIAYSLAEDKIGLDRLRTKFMAKMASSPTRRASRSSPPRSIPAGRASAPSPSRSRPPTRSTPS